MNPPARLYRYRPCDDQVLEREVEALANSYLFAPPFSAMNDPMEAFMEVGAPSDSFFTHLAPGAASSLDALYGQMSNMVEQFALISFSATHSDLPLWAYYASNFAGFCLEFDAETLQYGDLQGEQLHPVAYAKNALPALSVTELLRRGADPGTMLTSRLTRKREEWKHEKEWRYLVGTVGPKHFLDSALSRVFLGPRMPQAHIDRICATLRGRPVEILRGVVRGFELHFDMVQTAAEAGHYDRVGKGLFECANDLYSEASLREFLEVPFDALVDEGERLAAHPNMERFAGIDEAGVGADRLFIWTCYRLRNGREVNWQRYYDRRMRRVRKR